MMSHMFGSKWHSCNILNDPTQFEQIVVSFSDWVGSFFTCSPCVSRITGFWAQDAVYGSDKVQR